MQADGGVQLPPVGWIVFGVAVVVMLVIDHLAHRGDRAESRKVAAVWTAVWIGLGLGFIGVVWILLGGRAAREYLAAYLLEKSLSLDNLFVFLLIFHSLNVPRRHHHKVLFWGIVGALAFRALFIFAGVAAVRSFDWVSYAFGAILLFAAWRSLREPPLQETESRLVGWLSRHLPLSDDSHGGRFVAVEDGRRVATSLLVALVAIEMTDILFAVDSVAAALAVTREEFVLYTSNIFAILGLRSLYLLLENTITEFRHLHYGLAGVLAFAGLKLITEEWVHVPPLASVGAIVAILGTSIWTSLRARGPAPVGG